MREHQILGPIRSNAECMLALARISDLLDRQDADSVSELEMLSWYVESFDARSPTSDD